MVDIEEFCLGLAYIYVTMKFDYIVATDGACKGNPGPGTWAFVVFSPIKEEMLGHRKGHNPMTTNNEQELTAILEALKWANQHDKRIHILTDSQYCCDGILKWMNKWRADYWRRNNGESIKNLSLWRAVHEEWTNKGHTLHKVKGHSGNKFNEAADTYCNEEFLNAFM